ncbi:uncharacterized protein LOC125232678 [Leguminivora glycinivorella]|uniref:uncharacterized protein LOC125232678 n=1 Tax=Leguminivora glycinivorella TaxID=1035111 RepID=UPI00200F60C2|nr:uncharacterized protein LOC125232678 [Leguminivora glycinivorella]
MSPIYFVLFATLLAGAAYSAELARVKRQFPGGVQPEDPSDSAYHKLAQESLVKYLATSPGGPIDVDKIKVTKVTRQIVAGFKTVLDFTVTPANGEDFTCHSEVLEQAWLNKKDIDVKCNNEQVPDFLPGGAESKNPSDPTYQKLAQESLDKYLATCPGGPIEVDTIKVTKVTEQVVAGTKTVLDFTVTPANGKDFTCHSEVLEQAWLNKKDIDVKCNNEQVPDFLPGGAESKDPSDPTYQKLAQESLDKYLATCPGGPIEVDTIKVTKVTEQVVAGTKTVLDFTVTPANGEDFTCHSEVLEQPWLKKKDIDVNCNTNQQ